MKNLIMLRPETERDLEDAFAWYEDRRKGLGFEFLLCVDAGLKHIQRNPEGAKLEYRDVRRYVIRRFPYKIFYLVDNEKIIILGVIHGKRSRKHFQNRIQNI